ncbi:hypothetical protein [Laceyella putida]|uniref:Uncharacterized protein n=1 Tax=Laceyella putida TaxID=110101 RepID=A0ABW2RK92_9BACL
MKEFMGNFPIRMFQLDLRLTQLQLSQLVEEITGEALPKPLISQFVDDQLGTEAETLDNIFCTLGMTELPDRFDRNSKGIKVRTCSVGCKLNKR